MLMPRSRYHIIRDICQDDAKTIAKAARCRCERSRIGSTIQLIPR